MSKKISIAQFTAYGLTEKKWIIPTIWGTMAEFKIFLDNYGYTNITNIHEIPNTRYEIDEEK